VAANGVDRPLVRRSNFIQDSSRWDGFKFRPDDIVISTPPKCGTTWVQMITALLIFQTPELPAPMSTLSPWLDVRWAAHSQVLADLDKQTHRRFIKTHTARWGLPIADGVTYICVGRDPRDVALSWDDHAGNVDRSVSGARIMAAATIDGVDPPPKPDPPQEMSIKALRRSSGGGFSTTLRQRLSRRHCYPRWTMCSLSGMFATPIAPCCCTTTT